MRRKLWFQINVVITPVGDDVPSVTITWRDHKNMLARIQRDMRGEAALCDNAHHVIWHEAYLAHPRITSPFRHDMSIGGLRRHAC
ncbi:hypothetical protein WS61_08625 [Burkholderia sp. ABCPW 11]|nr:hypothetical protein WS61_08625 [Burkholderia sp. ABCPW 11]